MHKLNVQISSFQTSQFCNLRWFDLTFGVKPGNRHKTQAVTAYPSEPSSVTETIVSVKAFTKTKTTGLWSSAVRVLWTRGLQSRPSLCAMRMLEVSTEDLLHSESTDLSQNRCLLRRHKPSRLLNGTMPWGGPLPFLPSPWSRSQDSSKPAPCLNLPPCAAPLPSSFCSTSSTKLFCMLCHQTLLHNESLVQIEVFQRTGTERLPPRCCRRSAELERSKRGVATTLLNRDFLIYHRLGQLNTRKSSMRAFFLIFSNVNDLFQPRGVSKQPPLCAVLGRLRPPEVIKAWRTGPASAVFKGLRWQEDVWGGHCP